MKNKILLLSILLLLFNVNLCCAQNEQTIIGMSASNDYTSETAASELINKFNLGSNLKSIAIQATIMTVTYQILVKKHGEIGALKNLLKEMNKVLPEYQPAWNKNLINIYAKHFTVEDLLYFLKEGRSFHSTSKFKDKIDLIANDMKKESSEILKNFIEKVLMNMRQSTL
jgi:hypothetical protein